MTAERFRQQLKASLGAGGVHPFPATFLVPLVDLMNHGGASCNVDVRFDRQRGGFVLAAKRAIQTGDELRFGGACAAKSAAGAECGRYQPGR